jgi:hypothetical protein
MIDYNTEIERSDQKHRCVHVCEPYFSENTIPIVIEDNNTFNDIQRWRLERRSIESRAMNAQQKLTDKLSKTIGSRLALWKREKDLQ